MRAIFVAGTDTGVGKTLVCGLLRRYLSEKGLNVVTQKWVETGAGSRARISGDHRLPYLFKFPVSPHLAARLEGRSIDISKIKKSFKYLAKTFDAVVVEGTGGSLVPLCKNRLILDVAKELRLPVLIVAANRLGAVNHTLLTIEAVRNRQMTLTGIIFNEARRVRNRTVLSDNPEIVRAVSGETVLGSLPYTKDKDLLYRKFIPIGARCLKAMVNE